MTIGYVLDDSLDRSDGVQQAMIAIAEHMRTLGHDVHYIVAQTERTDLQNIHSVGKLTALQFNGNSIRTPIWVYRKKIKKLFNEFNFDVLHVQLPFSPVLARTVIKLAPRHTRIVGTFHILPYGKLSKIGTRLLGLVLRPARMFDKVYAVSQPALDFMQQTFGLSGSVLANPINYEFFHSFAGKKTQNSRLQYVFVGRFEERKGVRQLVKAYEIMKQRRKVDLIMCGSGPLFNELVAYNESQKLGIEFKGFVAHEEKARYLSSADVAVFPSTGGESFGIVLAEAMASGSSVTIGGMNPGYASVLGAWPETLFNAEEPQLIAQKLDEFALQNTLRTKLGSLQHEAVKAYDIKLIAARLINEAYQR